MVFQYFYFMSMEVDYQMYTYTFIDFCALSEGRSLRRLYSNFFAVLPLTYSKSFLESRKACVAQKPNASSHTRSAIYLYSSKTLPLGDQKNKLKLGIQ